MEDLIALVAATAGIASHLLYFNRGEHHMHGLRYVQAFILFTFTSVLALHKLLNHDLSDALVTVLVTEGYYFAGLYSSLVLWRLCLNPSNRIPGPFIARLSSFWWTFHIGMESRAFLKAQKLHAKYGSFVRIGPNVVSIAHPDGPNLLYGPGSRCRKAAWCVSAGFNAP